MERLGLGMPSLTVENSRQRGEIGSQVGVIGFHRRPADGHRTAGERLSPRVTAARVLQAPKVVVERRDERMIGTDAPVQSTKGASIHSGAVTEPSLVLVNDSQAVEQHRRLNVLCTQGAFCVRERLLEKLLGAIVPPGEPLAITRVSQPPGADREPPPPHR